MIWLAVAIAAPAFAAGYAARIVRPLDRIDTWAWDQDRRRARELRDGTAGRRRPGWWAAQTVFAVEIVAALVVRPRDTVHAWRHRKDPPPPRSPAVQIRHHIAEEPES